MWHMNFVVMPPSSSTPSKKKKIYKGIVKMMEDYTELHVGSDLTKKAFSEKLVCRSLLLKGLWLSIPSLPILRALVFMLNINGNRNLIQCLSVCKVIVSFFRRWIKGRGKAWLSEMHSYMDFFLKEASDSLKKNGSCWKLNHCDIENETKMRIGSALLYVIILLDHLGLKHIRHIS